jgi:hypothetical protein
MHVVIGDIVEYNRWGFSRGEVIDIEMPYRKRNTRLIIRNENRTWTSVSINDPSIVICKTLMK